MQRHEWQRRLPIVSLHTVHRWNGMNTKKTQNFSLGHRQTASLPRFYDTKNVSQEFHGIDKPVTRKRRVTKLSESRINCLWAKNGRVNAMSTSCQLTR
jgi:hypothetical protein